MTIPKPSCGEAILGSLFNVTPINTVNITCLKDRSGGGVDPPVSLATSRHIVGDIVPAGGRTAGASFPHGRRQVGERHAASDDATHADWRAGRCDNAERVSEDFRRWGGQAGILKCILSSHVRAPKSRTHTFPLRRRRRHAPRSRQLPQPADFWAFHSSFR